MEKFMWIFIVIDKFSFNVKIKVFNFKVKFCGFNLVYFVMYNVVLLMILDV